MLRLHVVHTKRFASIVQRPRDGSVHIGDWIPLRNKVTMLIDRTKGFIADFMINEDELAKIRTGAVFDDRLPTTGHRCRFPCTERIQIRRTLWFHHKSAHQAHHRQLTIIAVTMKLPSPFLHRRWNIPLHVHDFVFKSDRIGVRGCRRLARGAHHHT